MDTRPEGGGDDDETTEQREDNERQEEEEETGAPPTEDVCEAAIESDGSDRALQTPPPPPQTDTVAPNATETDAPEIAEMGGDGDGDKAKSDDTDNRDGGGGEIYGETARQETETRGDVGVGGGKEDGELQGGDDAVPDAAKEAGDGGSAEGVERQPHKEENSEKLPRPQQPQQQQEACLAVEPSVSSPSTDRGDERERERSSRGSVVESSTSGSAAATAVASRAPTVKRNIISLRQVKERKASSAISDTNADAADDAAASRKRPREGDVPPDSTLQPVSKNRRVPSSSMSSHRMGALSSGGGMGSYSSKVVEEVAQIARKSAPRERTECMRVRISDFSRFNAQSMIQGLLITRKRVNKPEPTEAKEPTKDEEKEEGEVFEDKANVVETRVADPKGDVPEVMETVENHEDLRQASIWDEKRMLVGSWCPVEVVEGLWKQKTRMDSVWDNGSYSAYQTIREAIFQHDRRAKQYANRDGDKLWQIQEEVDLFLNSGTGLTFLDLCGGPGAFSQVLLNRAPQPSYGWGVTLSRDAGAPDNKWWFPQLSQNKRWRALRGRDGTGNIYNPKNIAEVAKELKRECDRRGSGVDLVVSDGDFTIRQDSETGKHMENLQELVTGRLILSEVVTALSCLKAGGTFVCKLFDTFSHLTVSLLYVLALLFEEVFIVKPQNSHIVSSERYIAACGLQRNAPHFDATVQLLSVLHSRCADDTTPASVVPLSAMLSDSEFLSSVCDMARAVALKQTQALLLVMDGVDKLLYRTSTD
ncbi:ribosomal RNA large subunit methyltransferase J protein [Pelomyxa schiedti]|nr:ribosomal RNA large subunit methyltransferase J protein [Pelomyxa schiedti]